MLIRLSHHKGLGYPPVTKKMALPLTEQVMALAKQGSMVISFRPPLSGRPDKHIRKITAVERFLWAKAEQLVFYGVETDSALAPLILWDAAHAADVGCTLSLMGDRQAGSFLGRP